MPLRYKVIDRLDWTLNKDGTETLVDHEETHPIKKIEEDEGWKDMGRMGVKIFLAALEEAGGDVKIASHVTAAYFRGMFSGTQDHPSEEPDA